MYYGYLIQEQIGNVRYAQFKNSFLTARVSRTACLPHFLNFRVFMPTMSLTKMRKDPLYKTVNLIANTLVVGKFN